MKNEKGSENTKGQKRPADGDWKASLGSQPVPLVGVAVASGLVTGLLVIGRKKRSRARLLKRLESRAVPLFGEVKRSLGPVLNREAGAGKALLQELSSKYKDEIEAAKVIVAGAVADKLMDFSKNTLPKWAPQIAEMVDGLKNKMREEGVGAAVHPFKR